MNKYILHIISLVLLTFFSGCEKEEVNVTFTPDTGEGSTLTLTLSNSELESRTIAGVEDLNETLINRVNLFLYNVNSEEANPVKEYTVDYQTTNESKKGSTSISINVPTDIVLAYAIVNGPSIPSKQSKTIKDLKKIAIESSFDTKKTQDDFVMDGKGEISLVTENSIKKLKGTITLKRSAAKIQMIITKIVPTIKEGTDIWEPNLANMKAYFYHGVKKSIVHAEKAPSGQDVYFDLDQEETASSFVAGSVVNENKQYVQSTPFYSYPSDWSIDKDKDEEPYMILVLPWRKQSKDENAPYTTFYYKVPVNETPTAPASSEVYEKLVRNTFYRINLEVGILGSTELTDETVSLIPSCILLNWGEEMINAELNQPRYLVAEDTIRIYNQNSVNIPFESSHPISSTITVDRCYRQELVNGDNENRSAEGTLRINGNNVVYTRELDNNFTHASQSLGGTFDFTPYYTTFTIKQDGDTEEELSKTITIIQYPAIYGTRQVNSDYPDSQNYGFAFVNGYNKGFSRDNQDNFDPIQGSPSGNGVSSNAMLIFTVTSTEGTDYIIGDPRELLVNQEFINTTHTVSNKSYSIWDSAPSLYGESPRYLQNYYATETHHNNLRNASSTDDSRINEDETPLYQNETEAIANERTYNMIAPKFRISSGYGAVSATQVERQYYDMMKKRCASYQEDGYPAGRWRLPTMAEFKFIIYLSYHGKIPQLFSPTMPYWCAHGFGKANNENVTPSFYTDYGGTGISVRCVYDDWYWGSEPVLKTEAEKNTFTWGDQPREQ